MKTIFVTVDPAFPPVSGADLRSWQNVLAASEIGPTLLLSIGRPSFAIPPPSVQIEHLEGMNPADIWRSEFDVAFSAETVERFCLFCAQFQPDVVVLESLAVCNLATVAKDLTRALVVDLHNVESDLVAQGANIEQREQIRHGIQVRAKRVAALEQTVGAIADMTWVCSSDDRDRLVASGADVNRIFVVPNGIPRSETMPVWTPREKGSIERPVLLFLGHLHYLPNVEAALLLTELMPAIRERVAGARLILAGRNPHPALVSRSRAGTIDVVANPVSTSPVLSTAHLAVMPLRRGGGTRIKALEAIAWGLPIVATARAVEGLQLQDGIHVRIAENQTAFVTAVCELCENPDLYESQRTAARSHVMAHFGPAIIRQKVQMGLQRALDA
jgi:glycosyltransferase involved in cell wall biosynthesis